jgi:cold shock CspA family protein
VPTGVVATFDERRGLGTIRTDTAEYSFHSTRIADGSRVVDPGQAVTFALVPGRRGDWEAVDIEKTVG